jgi:succinate-semialdehyde dehydrogenase / glutarate-semialdehyde dehydrogenase
MVRQQLLYTVMILVIDMVFSDPGTGQKWATCTDMATEDVEDAVQSAYAAFQKYRTVNPRTRADLRSKWDALIRENKDDIAKILVYETGKPFAEAQREIEYAASFTRWFAGEAERIQGTAFAASTPG